MDARYGIYEELIEPIEARMIQSVWRIVRDPDDAADALQQALETIWRRLPRIRRHPNPQALILRICVNSAYDTLRRKARQRRHEAPEPLPDHAPDPAATPAEQAVAHENRSEIFAAIAGLPRKQAQAVLMRFVDGAAYRDIAQAFGCTEATVRKHIARARARLQNELAHLLPQAPQEVPK